MHEVEGAIGIALTDKPARNQFVFRVDWRPRPNIASAVCFHFRVAIFCFRSHKTSNLIALKSAAFQVAKSFVLILRAGSSKIAKQLNHNAGHSDSAANAVPFNKAIHDPHAVCQPQSVHARNPTVIYNTSQQENHVK
jgi:hypothetical protein